VSAAPRVGLRPTTPDDRAFLARVYASTREQELARVPFSAAEKAAFLEHQFEAQSRHYAQHYHDTSFDVIEVDGAPAGRLIVGRWKREIRVVDIALLPEHRGRGVGTRVLAPVLAEADARGVPTTIHVETLNPAQRLYRRLGFVPVDEPSEGTVYLLWERPPGATAAGADAAEAQAWIDR
jgi:GNAT superfamily N-acetyltransferase